jgi:hypothetical protein
VIDGFDARPAAISGCFCGIGSPHPDQEPHDFSLILETPVHPPSVHPFAAKVAALDAVRATCRGVIPHAPDL